MNWLQGDQGESGLPDIRAQVGFIAEDGRFFTVVGSGTDNVSYGKIGFFWLLRSIRNYSKLFYEIVMCVCNIENYKI